MSRSRGQIVNTGKVVSAGTMGMKPLQSAASVALFPRKTEQIGPLASCEGLQHLACLLPELGAHEAVDKDVGAAVDHQKKVADTDHDQGPQLQPTRTMFHAFQGVLNRTELVSNFHQHTGR